MGDSFTNVFGGSTVQPSEVRYRLIRLIGNVNLFWPQQGIDTESVIAKWNDVNAVGSFNITFPDATTIGPGQDAVFNNISSVSFQVLANDGTPIANILPGQAIYIINWDNSTIAGSWRVVTFGAGSSQAQASSLAGAGLLAAAGVLNLNIPVQSIGTNYNIMLGDRATVLNWTGGAGTITPIDPSSAGNGWLCEIRNSGSGALTIGPAVGNIDGNATKTLNQTESAILHTDGANYFTVGYGRSIISTFTRLVVSVAGNTDVALSSSQAQNQVVEFTGALTGNINVTVPANVAEYFAFNNTTGAHTLTFKTVSGTGVVLTQGNRQITHCDGTDIVLSNSAGTGTVTAVTAGAGLAGGTITSTGTLSIASTAVTPGAYTSANITIGADGRITAAANGSGGSVLSVTAGAGLIGGTITTTGTIALPSTGVTPGDYVASAITIDTFGRITAASSGSFLPIGGGTLTGDLQVVSAGASLFLATTGHHEWQLLSNTDNNFYIIDDTSGGTRLILTGSGAQVIGALTATSINAGPTTASSISAGSINAGPISASTIAGTVIAATSSVQVNRVSAQAFYTSTVQSVRTWSFGTNVDANFYIQDTSVGGNRVIIDTAGNFTVVSGNAFKPGGGAWAATSDERIKAVLGEYTKGLDEILQLDPVTYVYKGNDAPSADAPSLHAGVAAAETPFIGLVAQKLEKVFPEMVTETTGFIDGQPVNDLRSVDTSLLVYALVNAVKTLSARVETLEAQMASK